MVAAVEKRSGPYPEPRSIMSGRDSEQAGGGAMLTLIMFPVPSMVRRGVKSP